MVRKILSAAALYLLVFFLIELSYRPTGEVVDFPGVDFPYVEELKAPTWRSFKTIIRSEGGRETYLVLSRIEAQGIEVKLNGMVIFRVGGDGIDSKIWTNTFAVPLELRDGENELEIRLWSSVEYVIPVPPFLSDNPWPYVVFSRVLFNWLSSFISPILFFLGFVYMRLSLKIPDHRNTLLFMGLSSIFASVFVLYYSSNIQMAPTGDYSMVNRIFLSSIIPMVVFYHSAVEAFVGSVRSWKWVVPLGLIFTTLVITVEGYHELVETLRGLVIPVSVVLFLYSSYKLATHGKIEYSVSPAFLAISALHYSLSLAHGKPLHPLVVVGIVYTSADFMNFISSYHDFLMLEKEKAYIDPLTGVYNRRKLAEVELSAGDSIIFFDIDDFKEYNDLHGHDYGDRLLRVLAQTIKRNIKGKDIVVRYGGDEFVVVLKECGLNCARDIARSIEMEFMRKTGCRVSYGISPASGNLRETLLNADKKMYEMKKERKFGGFTAS